MRVAPRVSASSKQGTAHPPIPRPPAMQDWLNRPRPSLFQRLRDAVGRGAHG